MSSPVTLSATPPATPPGDVLVLGKPPGMGVPSAALKKKGALDAVLAICRTQGFSDAAVVGRVGARSATPRLHVAWSQPAT